MGCSILAALAIVDLYQHGRAATRWREYAFLVLCVGVAILYGIVNDQITCTISWEYFYYGKDLALILGPPTPPAAMGLRIQALRIGASATWWAGRIIGAGMLMANNPSRELPRLKYFRLIARLPGILLITAACAAVFGLAGDRYLLNWISPDFKSLAETDLWRAHRFMTVYGVHLGGYVGGLIAVGYAVVSIRRERGRLA